jgi:hypothetical protein
MDGQPLTDRLTGQALAVDPGDHTFTFTAEGLPSVTRRVVIHESEKGRRESIMIGTPITPNASATTARVIQQPAQASGRLVIKATEPGKVFIDGGERGVAPIDVPDLPAGTHTIRVEFDEGGSSTLRVSVMANQTTDINVEPSAGAKVFAFRRGVHLGATAEGTIYTGSSSISMLGARLSPFINYGATPGVELRVGPVVGIGQYTSLVYAGNGTATGTDQSSTYFQIGAHASLRLDLGAFYVIAIGAGAGFLDAPATPPTTAAAAATAATRQLAPYIVAEVSPLTIRFGARREFELGYTFGIGAFSVQRNDGSVSSSGQVGSDFKSIIENMVGFTYVLPSFF